ncbi:MAG: PaaI family thioesterase [Pseudomonadaceae bacterium]
MSSPDIPDGFAPHTRRSGLTDPWEPLYAMDHPDGLSLGLRAGPAHSNSRGFVHGGLISALADNAMGLSCGRRLSGIGGLVTVNLSVDFLGKAQCDQWLEIRATVRKAGRSLCFADALISANGELCARASGVFKVIPGPKQASDAAR